MVDAGIPPLSLVDRKRYCARVYPPFSSCCQTMTSFEIVVGVFNSMSEQLDAVLRARMDRVERERAGRRFWVFWAKSDAERGVEDGVGAGRPGLTTMKEWFEPANFLQCLFCGRPATDDPSSALGLIPAYAACRVWCTCRVCLSRVLVSCACRVCLNLLGDACALCDGLCDQRG